MLYYFFLLVDIVTLIQLRLPQNWCNIALVEWSEPFHWPEHDTDEEYQTILKKKKSFKKNQAQIYWRTIDYITLKVNVQM